MATTESTGMRLSLFSAIFHGVLGISFSFFAESQAVLLDGAFNLVSAMTVFFAIRIHLLLNRAESVKTPVGYIALEPLYVVVKGLIVLSLTIYVLISSVLIMLDGGNNLNLGIVVIYIFIAMTGNTVTFLLIRRAAMKSNSPMLNIEKENWMINALITSSIGVSFLVVFFLKDSFLAPIVPYIDQIIVIIVGVLTFSVPLKSLIGSLKELLLLGTDENLRLQIRSNLANHLPEEKVENWDLSMLKLGRKYFLWLHIKPVEKSISSKFCDDLNSSLSPHISREISDFSLDIMISQKI